MRQIDAPENHVALVCAKARKQLVLVVNLHITERIVRDRVNISLFVPLSVDKADVIVAAEEAPFDEFKFVFVVEPNLLNCRCVEFHIVDGRELLQVVVVDVLPLASSRESVRLRVKL